MWKILFLVCISFCQQIFSQTLEQSKVLADSLFNKGLTTESIELYDRIIFFSPDTLKPSLYIKKSQLLSFVGDNKQAINNLTYAYYLANGNDSLQKKIITSLAICTMLNEDYISAINLLEENYKPEWYAVKEKSLLLGISYAFINFKKEAKINFELAGYPELGEKISKQIGSLKRKSFLINASSVVMPGSGQIILGETNSGLKSLALNGAFGAGFYYFTAFYNPLDALILVGAFWSRYYLGNIAKTVAINQTYVSNKKKIIIKDLLK
ncbi:MAG: hypothetical protein SFY32_12690 [Bacteroidota bacterium]|nr:hypothetical protein [Bacteroidota bacterium]